MLTIEVWPSPLRLQPSSSSLAISLTRQRSAYVGLNKGGCLVVEFKLGLSCGKPLVLQPSSPAASLSLETHHIFLQRLELSELLGRQLARRLPSLELGESSLGRVELGGLRRAEPATDAHGLAVGVQNDTARANLAARGHAWVS